MQWTTTGDRITLPYVAPEDDLQSTPATIKALAEAVVAELELATPVGAISPYMGDVAPDGWLLCDGSQYDPSDLPELAAVNGAFHADDAPGEFRVPDLRGRSPIGTCTDVQFPDWGTGPVAPIALGVRKGDWRTKYGVGYLAWLGAPSIPLYKAPGGGEGAAWGLFDTASPGSTIDIGPGKGNENETQFQVYNNENGADHNWHPVTGVNFIVYAGRPTVGISPLSELAPVTAREMIERRLAEAGIGEEEIKMLKEQLEEIKRTEAA